MHDKSIRIKFWFGVLAVFAAVIFCFVYLGLDAVALITLAPTFVRYIAVNFFPPSMTNLQANLATVLQTVAFAVVSTYISSFLAFIFALLMSDVVMPYRAVRIAVRFFMTFVRNIPVVIWATLMVFVFGIGSMVGLVALVLATTGFLSRSYAESINEISARKLEPLRASGVRTHAIIIHGVLPEFAPAWVNWTLFAFELNIRASAVLGMVGAGGMGILIQRNLTLRNFQGAATLILLLIVAVVCAEFFSAYVRKKVMGDGGHSYDFGAGALSAIPANVRKFRAFVIVAALVVFVASLLYLDLDMARFIGRLENVPRIMGLLMEVNLDIVGHGLRQFFVSLVMGIAGLVLGGFLAVILAFLAAENIAPFRPLAVVIKAFASVVRAVPSLVVMLMIVAAIGFGYTTGVAVLTISSMGYLTRAFIATIEEEGRASITAMSAAGASFGQIIVHGLLPAVATGFLSWIALRLEMSVAESITLGVVGAGGIGALIFRATRQFDYPTVSTLILIVFLCMFCLEMVARGVRRFGGG